MQFWLSVIGCLEYSVLLAVWSWSHLSSIDFCCAYSFLLSGCHNYPKHMQLSSFGGRTYVFIPCTESWDLPIFLRFMIQSYNKCTHLTLVTECKCPITQGLMLNLGGLLSCMTPPEKTCVKVIGLSHLPTVVLYCVWCWFHVGRFIKQQTVPFACIVKVEQLM